jgi:hypothetical protein
MNKYNRVDVALHWIARRMPRRFLYWCYIHTHTLALRDRKTADPAKYDDDIEQQAIQVIRDVAKSYRSADAV